MEDAEEHYRQYGKAVLSREAAQSEEERFREKLKPAMGAPGGLVIVLMFCHLACTKFTNKTTRPPCLAM